MKNHQNNPEIPMGLGMALSQNLQAMEYYASLSPDMQRTVIDHTHCVRSRQEMLQYVQGLPFPNSNQ